MLIFRCYVLLVRVQTVSDVLATGPLNAGWQLPDHFERDRHTTGTQLVGK